MPREETLKDCLQTIAQREQAVVKPSDMLWWLIGVHYGELTPHQVLTLLERAGIAQKPAYIKESHTVSFPEYGKEEVVPAQIIAQSPASRDVRRAEEFALFEVREKKQE